MSKSSIAAVALVLVMVASAFTVATANVAANKGNRDSFGYAWTDSKSPDPTVAFNWVEIRSTGTNSYAYGDESMFGPYPIGFNFTFYGNRYTAFNISTNGYIQFNGKNNDLSPHPMPYSLTPNNIIAFYWDDMEMDNISGKGIYYETKGVSPNRMLVIEFLNLSEYIDSSNPDMTMEVILEEDGDIWMQYLTLNGETANYASVGIENSDGTIATQYSHDTACLQDGLAIRYWWSPVVIGPSATKVGPPGTELSYTLTVTNKMGMADSFAIQTSGVEGWTVNMYDPSWNALTDTDSDGLPDTGTVGAGGSVTIIVNVSIPDPFVNPVEYTIVNASAHSNPLLYDMVALTSRVSDCWFDPPHVSSVTDPDGDGDYNTLDLNVSLYCSTSGWYYIYAYLYTASSYYVGMDTASVYCVPGAESAVLRWMGWLIRNQADDGQLRIELTLYNSAWTVIDTDTHYTAYYAATQFMLPPAVFAPPHYDSPIDTDSDGLYEALVMHANLTVNYDGLFRVTAYMYDEYGYYMFSNYTEVNLVAGARTVDVWFDSEQMRMSSMYGSPYDITLMLAAYVDGTWWSLGNNYYTTGSYDDALFQAPDAFFQRPHTDLPVDTNSDGYYDWFYVDVGVNVTVAGDYTITGELYVWSYVDTDSNNTYLDVGYHSVRLSFPGWPIRYNADNYWIDVDLTLNGPTGTLDTDSFRTSTYYYYNDFAVAPGWFVTYECAVEDTNADGLYDYLLTNVTVNVTADGIYEVHADLYDWWGNTICDLTDRQYLTAGEHVFYFAFPGWMVRANGYDPDAVYMYLYDEDGRQMDTYNFFTPSWSYLDFQTLPAYFGSTGNQIYPHDTGTDGVNDTMIMEVNVTVDTPGSFYVVGSLSDWYGVVVGTQRVLVSLSAGSNLVTLTFPGWLIHAIAVNGTYWCTAYLYDDAMNSIDVLGFSGGYWYNDFNGAVPRMNSAWADHAPAIDGVLAAGEWTNATVVDMRTADSMNMVGAKLMVMNNATRLFIAFDVFGDTSDDNNDLSSFAFDTGNDDVGAIGREDEFNSYAYGWQGHYVFNGGTSWVNDCSPFDTASDNHSGLAGSAGFGYSPAFAYSHRIFEYSVPLSLLNASAGDVLGFMTATHYFDGLADAHNWTYSAWPVLVAHNDLTTYGELVLASHVAIPPPVTTHALVGTMGENSWYATAVTVTLSATGGDGGVDRTEYSLDGGAWTTYAGPIIVQTNGTHSMSYRSTDAASQVESTKTVSFNIDGAAPVTAAGKSGTWVWLNATDPHSGVSSIVYRIDGGSWVTYTGKFNVTGDKGEHTVEFYAKDSAGNIEAIKSVTVEITTGTGGGVSGLLSNPILWIALVAAAVAAILLIVLLMAKRRKGQQPVMYPGPGQPMPGQPQPMPEYPPPPGPPVG